LITPEATPNPVSPDTDEEFKPVVRVQEGKDQIPDAQKDRFDKLFEEGKKLYQEKMDYEGAIKKFNEALDLAVTRTQRADLFYHISLAHYGDLSEKGTKELYETMSKLIEIDYYRELDELLCPPRYIELFEGIKKEYGVLRVQSKPAGADVYLRDSETPAGKTPLMIGAKAGSLTIKIKKGKKAKNDILKVVAGKETTSPIYVLKGTSTLLYILGGLALAVGTGAVLLSKGGATDDEPGVTTGSIQVSSTPQGASIHLDGTDTGQTTNSTLTNVSSGNHTVTLVKEGYEDYVQNISVTAGQTTTVNANLTATIITVTNPTSSTIWTKGSNVEIRWTSSGSLSSQGNVRKSAGLNSLSQSERNLSPSFRRRRPRSRHSFLNIMRTGRQYSFRNIMRTGRQSDNRSSMGSPSIKEISSSKAPGINLNKPSRLQDASKNHSSSGKEVNISHQRAENLGIIKKNNSFGKVSSPVPEGISPQIFKSSKNTRVLSITNVKIDLYKGGVPRETIESNTENDGTYTWIVKASLEDGSDYKIRVSAASEPGIFDESDNFTIETKSITVISPNGGENWEVGSVQTITWTWTSTVGDVKIEYSADNGSSWLDVINSTPNSGFYSWLIPDDPSSECLVRISETDTDPSDTSDAVFTIATPPAITITAPNGGENWEVDSIQQITWTPEGAVGKVKIEYSTDSGASWKTIKASANNTGSYSWRIPDDPSTNCLVRVSEIDGDPSDVSDNVFEIAPPP
jgi:hypothetical protein